MKVARLSLLLVAALAQLVTGCRWSSDGDVRTNIASSSSPATAAAVGTTDRGSTNGAGGAIASGATPTNTGTGTGTVGTTPTTGTTNAGTGSGGVTVAWQAPQYNEDGTPLLDLAGFRIRHGMTYGSYTSQINVDNPGATSHRVQGLRPGLYYFVVSAVDREGQEGEPSRPQRVQVL